MQIERWEKLWRVLASQKINHNDPECENKENGEIWQYMSSQEETEAFVFRHRHHPRTQQREKIIIRREQLS